MIEVPADAVIENEQVQKEWREMMATLPKIDPKCTYCGTTHKLGPCIFVECLVDQRSNG